MFNPWTPNNLNDLQSMWSKAWGANLPQTPSVYSQMHELGNAFRTFFDTAQDQSQQTAQQQILEQIVKQFTINPTIPNFPTPPTFADPSQLGNLANLGANWLNPQMPSAQPPALGIGREFQEDWSELLRLQQEYGSAVREFTEVYNKFVQAASTRFANSLGEIEETTGFEDVCRQWIECCDDEFQKIAMTEEYCSTYGTLINSYMRLLRQSKKIQEQMFTLAGQPTRTELNELHRKNKQAASEIESLSVKIKDLENRLEKAKPAPKRAARKPVAAKKTGGQAKGKKK